MPHNLSSANTVTESCTGKNAPIVTEWGMDATPAMGRVALSFAIANPYDNCRLTGISHLCIIMYNEM